MFTLEQIHAAHRAEFPQYVQDLISLGVKSFETFVEDGRTTYHGLDIELNELVQNEKLTIADESSAESLENIIKIHQAGETDFPTFCAQSAGAGVEKWIMDLDQMKCIYFDKAGKVLVSENIPTP